MFCNWLSGKAGLTPCYERTGEKDKDYKGKPTKYDAWQVIPESNGYRLPTEAEWEYACRAGTATTFSYGDDESLLDRYAVHRASRTEVPGSKLPNDWGLFDVHGNVYEWCQDWYEEDYTSGAVTDPTGPSSGSFRVFRGGSWRGSDFFRSAFRRRGSPVNKFIDLGFRVLRSSIK
jgi:formylglycine-generating enzyme required for sulfatase activity